jgi:hypothetical protein
MTPILYSYFLRCFESKILLRQVTEGDHDDGGDDFGNSGIEVKMFYKETDENIVQYNTNQDQQKIAEQLYASVQDGTWKNHVAHEHKSRGKADQKGYNKGGNMRFKRNKAEV